MRCRWGNKLSNKMFVAKKFVLKHVRSKHDDKLQAEKERVRVAGHGQSAGPLVGARCHLGKLLPEGCCPCLRLWYFPQQPA